MLGNVLLEPKGIKALWRWRVLEARGADKAGLLTLALARKHNAVQAAAVALAACHGDICDGGAWQRALRKEPAGAVAAAVCVDPVDNLLLRAAAARAWSLANVHIQSLHMDIYGEWGGGGGAKKK